MVTGTSNANVWLTNPLIIKYEMIAFLQTTFIVINLGSDYSAVSVRLNNEVVE